MSAVRVDVPFAQTAVALGMFRSCSHVVRVVVKLALPTTALVGGPVLMPHQLSFAVTLPQFLPSRVQNAAFASATQLLPHTFAVPAPPHVCGVPPAHVCVTMPWHTCGMVLPPCGHNGLFGLHQRTLSFS